MFRANRIAHIGASRIVAMFVREHAFQHEELLAAAMSVFAEIGFGRVADNGGRACDLLANPVKHLPINPCHRRGDPVAILGAQDDALIEVCIQSHEALLYPPGRNTAINR